MRSNLTSTRRTLLSAAVASIAAGHAAPRDGTPPPVLGSTDADLTAPKSDTELEQAVEALKPTAPRITKEHIQALIVDESYTNIEGTRTTVCRLGLANGFCVVGVNNGPVSAANFDQQIGCEYAYKAAVDQIWPLEGYLLAERLWSGDVAIEKLAKLRNLVAIQTGDPISQTDSYMRGMANGLLMALSVYDGSEPEFIPASAGEKTAVDRILAAQGVLVRHAPPNGLNDRDALTELYEILDKPLAPHPGVTDWPAHQQRVANEHAEMVDKISRLDAFFLTPQFGALDLAEQNRLTAQRTAMCDYMLILQDRINHF